MRILILGAGAIGSVFGGLLAEAGNEVYLIGRDPHMHTIRHRGLVIEGIWGDHHIYNVHAYTLLENIPHNETLDVVLLTVKSYDTQAVLEAFNNISGVMPPVVSLQNGLGNLERIEHIAGREKTIGGRVIFGVEYTGPGRVRVTVSADNTLIGILPGAADAKGFVHLLADNFTRAGIPTRVTENIISELWGKVLYNCSLNALASLLDCNYGTLLTSRYTRSMITCIIQEIYAVAEKKNIELAWRTPEAYAECLFGELIPRTSGHHPSMLQDIHRGKKTEIDALNGAVVRLAREYDLPAPTNETITELISAKELLCKTTAPMTKNC